MVVVLVASLLINDVTLYTTVGTFTSQVDVAQCVAMGCCQANTIVHGYTEPMAKKKKKRNTIKKEFLGSWESSVTPTSRPGGLHNRHVAFVPHLSVVTKTISGAEAPAALSRCQQVRKGIAHVCFETEALLMLICRRPCKYAVASPVIFIPPLMAAHFFTLMI